MSRIFQRVIASISVRERIFISSIWVEAPVRVVNTVSWIGGIQITRPVRIVVS